MRAAVHQRYGGPQSVAIRELAAPIPKDGEVLVRVCAASVNSWDWDKLTGSLLTRLIAPFGDGHSVLGADIAGVVESMGEGGDGLALGDRVAGDISDHGWGGFAEYVAVPATALVRIPDGVSFVDAAAVPQAGTLALQALRKRRPLRAGEHVLINGAGGGVGTFAIQLAKRMGAEVTAVDHGAKRELMRALGADHVLDYAREDFTASGRRFDRIVDPVARRRMAQYRRVLKADGTFVVVGGNIRTLIATALASLSTRSDGQDLGLLIWRAATADMTELLEFVASGAIRPVVDRVYPLEETGEALRRVGEGKALGKVVVRVAE